MDFKYMYGKQADQYSFIHIPKMLVTEKIFTGITIHAKVLYGLLLDRMGMAVKNKWVDERNRMYVVYPIQEIQKDMGVTRKKARECLTELENAGLIEKHFRGMGLPSIYYVKDFAVLVYADSCPVVSIVEKTAKKYEIPVVLLCDTIKTN